MLPNEKKKLKLFQHSVLGDGLNGVYFTRACYNAIVSICNSSTEVTAIVHFESMTCCKPLLFTQKYIDLKIIRDQAAVVD